MIRRFVTWFAIAGLILALMSTAGFAESESYSANTMRLMRHDGDVVIEDTAGNARFVMDNVRFASGEAMRTGAGSSASVSLDSTKIVSLDENSACRFEKNGSHIELTLTEGTLFLDVSEKLDENESLDIVTSTMTVGIRGTITVVSVMPASSLPNIYGLNAAKPSIANEQVTVFGVLEGSADVTGQNGQTATVSAGQIAVIGADTEIADMTKENVTPFIRDQFEDSNTASRVMNSCPQLFEDYDFPADGDWEYTGKVLIVAQSASKLYDGNPLTRTGDILVYNLPELFDITAKAVGSITNAGTAENPIGSYAIYNKNGENVTSHFNIIETIAGQLVVDPAPMTIWTGDATKAYDGTPLTNEEAGFDVISGN
ncbi:MAG: FecR domain-containing protein, partial [Clostridia bacterium]|nr:FecR domain-containing protein [Clostridia bacterium]